jgi:hypothetical protein
MGTDARMHCRMRILEMNVQLNFVGRCGLRAHPTAPARAVALARRAAARLDPSDGRLLREHGQAGCAGGNTIAARSRARGSRALDSFTLRVNDERT